MRCLIITSTLIGVALGVISGEALSPPKGALSKIRADLRHHHGEADHDGDGEITAADLAAHAEKIAGATDKLRAARVQQRAAAQEFFANHIDTNGDNKVTREEFVTEKMAHVIQDEESRNRQRAAAEEFFDKHVGANAGSKVTRKEFVSTQMVPVKDLVAAVWESFPHGKNPGATITRETFLENLSSFTKAAENLVAMADANGNGKLSLSEMQGIAPKDDDNVNEGTIDSTVAPHVTALHQFLDQDWMHTNLLKKYTRDELRI